MSSDDIKKNTVPKGLYQIISDMVKDILITFPEEKETLNSDLRYVINNSSTIDGVDTDSVSILTIYEFCKQQYPPHFLHIMYQNEELFVPETLELLPGINFSKIWKLNISNGTKETLWKYLQLVLFNTISVDLDGAMNSNMFKDNSELNTKMSDLLSNVQDYLCKQSSIDANIPKDSVKQDISVTPSGAECFNDTATATATNDATNNATNNATASDTEEKVDMNKLLGGKLGEMAREIASEASGLFSSDDKVESVGDALKNMLKNPSKVMNMIKHVGDKLENNIKSGKISETDLLTEASDVLKTMKNIPGFSSNGLMDMLKNMGGMGGMGGMNPLSGLESLFGSNTQHAEQQTSQSNLHSNKAKDNKPKRQLTVQERLQKKLLEKNK